MYLYNNVFEDLFINKANRINILANTTKVFDFKYVIYIDIKYYENLNKSWIYQSYYSLLFFLGSRPRYMRLWFKKSHKPKMYRGLFYKGFNKYEAIAYFLNLLKLLRNIGIRTTEIKLKNKFLIYFVPLIFIKDYDMHLIFFKWNQRIKQIFNKDYTQFTHLICNYILNRS